MAREPSPQLGPRDRKGTARQSVLAWTGVSLQSASIPALVEEAKDANPEAWTKLVSRFGMMIAATGRRYRLTPADVAELQQTTWLRLVENIHRVEQPERSVGGWPPPPAGRACYS